MSFYQKFVNLGSFQVKRAIADSGHILVDETEAIKFLRDLSDCKQIEVVKNAAVNMICPAEDEIEPVIKGWTNAQQGSLLRRLGWHHNVEFMVQGPYHALLQCYYCCDSYCIWVGRSFFTVSKTCMLRAVGYVQ